MKIKGLIIAGSIFLASGVALTSYAATRDDFDLKGYVASNVTVNEDTFDLAEYEITTIDFKSEIEYLKVVTTTENKIVVKSKECEAFNYDIIYEAEEKSLVITQKTEDQWFFKSFDLKFLSFFKNGQDLPFVIEVPASLAASLNVSISAGVAEINDINFANLVTKVDFGAIETKGITAEKVNLSCDCGSIVYKGKVTDEGVFKMNCGSIWMRLDGAKADYTVNGKGNGDAKIITDYDCGNDHIEYTE